MSAPLNLNTATLNQLKAIHGIGESKAKSILQKKKEVSTLTRGALEEISGISSTLLDSLFSDKVVTLEEEGREIESSEELQQTIKALRKKIADMEIERSDTADSFQAQYDKIREQGKIQIDSILAQHEQTLRQQKQEFDKEMEHIRIKREGENKEFLNTIEKQEQELKSIHDHKKKLQQQLEQKEPVSKLENVIADRESKAYPTTQKDTTMENRTYSSAAGPVTPRMSIYDGKIDWRPYHLQFTMIADHFNWSTEQRLFKLIECLRDKALIFYSDRSKSVQNDYVALCQKLNERFGKKESPHILRRILQDLKQDAEELLEEFAEQARGIAADGYPDTSDRVVETLATDAFLRGCIGKRAALVAMDKNPTSLDQALQFVRSAVANQKVIMGGKRCEVKRVTFEEETVTEETEVGPLAIRKFDKEEDKKGVSLHFEKRLSKTEEDLSDTKVIVKRILNILNQNQGQRSGYTPRSPTRERSNSPTDRQARARGACFNCGNEGHFARECPTRRNFSPNRSRSPLPSPLNYNRSRMMANS